MFFGPTTLRSPPYFWFQIIFYSFSFCGRKCWKCSRCRLWARLSKLKRAQALGLHQWRHRRLKRDWIAPTPWDCPDPISTAAKSWSGISTTGWSHSSRRWGTWRFRTKWWDNRFGEKQTSVRPANPLPPEGEIIQNWLRYSKERNSVAIHYFICMTTLSKSMSSISSIKARRVVSLTW